MTKNRILLKTKEVRKRLIDIDMKSSKFCDVLCQKRRRAQGWMYHGHAVPENYVPIILEILGGSFDTYFYLVPTKPKGGYRIKTSI